MEINILAFIATALFILVSTGQVFCFPFCSLAAG